MRITRLFLGSLLTEKNNAYLNWMHTSINYPWIHKPQMLHFRRTSSSVWFVERRALSGLCLEDREIQQDAEGQERRREHMKPSSSQENEPSGAEQREERATLSLQDWCPPIPALRRPQGHHKSCRSALGAPVKQAPDVPTEGRRDLQREFRGCQKRLWWEGRGVEKRIAHFSPEILGHLSFSLQSRKIYQGWRDAPKDSCQVAPRGLASPCGRDLRWRTLLCQGQQASRERNTSAVPPTECVSQKGVRLWLWWGKCL